MQSDALILPDAAKIRAHILTALSRYWSEDAALVEALPIQQQPVVTNISGPLRLVPIDLPSWAKECSVNGQILVPTETVMPQKEHVDAWQHTDWWLAAFLLLEGWHERVWEHQNGPIHSYSFRLIGWDERAWQHAWVNRIGLFLRAWVIERGSDSVEGHLGPLPKPKIQMTHDVDAVEKTLSIRLKQGAFNLFNAVRALRKGQLAKASSRIKQAYRFMLGREDWWLFEPLLDAERQSNICATFHFYADPRPKTLKRWLFDPGYDISALKQRTLLQNLKVAGHEIGLHPGFDTWQDATKISEARQLVEGAAGVAVTHVRQHWLRFSWRETWNAQAIAGLTQDATLMFNDRPGYRTSSALTWQPWNSTDNAAHRLSAIPTVLMDSHCYDYQPMTAQQRQQAIKHWIGECQAVHGQVAILWHPHTLGQDYGWSDGFNDTLASLKENRP